MTHDKHIEQAQRRIAKFATEAMNLHATGEHAMAAALMDDAIDTAEDVAALLRSIGRIIERDLTA